MRIGGPLPSTKSSNNNNNNISSSSSSELERNKEKEVFENEIDRLRKENTSMRDHLQRALKELRLYQLKYPSAYITIDNNDDENLPPWTTSPDVVTPLFEAYDTRIKELEEIGIQQSSQIATFREKIGTLVTENDKLRLSQLESIKQMSSKGDGIHISSELEDELNERINILMAENSIMLEQKTIINAELDKYQNELIERTQDLAIATQKLSVASKDIQNYRSQIVQLEKDREEVATQAVNFSDNLGKVEMEVDELRLKLLKSEQRCNDLERDIQDLSSQNKGIKDKIHEDIHMYVQRSKIAEERVRELHTLLLNKNKELDSANEVIRKLKREYQSTRQDAEGMLQVMSGLERQLLGYTSREAEVEKLAKDNKEKVEIALMERDRAIGKEEQLSKELQRLTEDRKKLLVERQHEIELAIEQTRIKCCEQLKSLEADIQKMAESNASLKVESERTIREGKTYRENYDRLLRLLEDERKGHASTIKEISEKLTSSLTSKEDEVGKREEIQELNKELRNTIDKLRIQTDSLQSQIVQIQRSSSLEVSNLKGIIRNNQIDLAEKERVILRRKKDLEDMKHTLETETANAERKYSDETLMLRRRVLENENMIKDLENNSINNLKQHQMLLEQLSEKHEISIKQLTSKYGVGLNDITEIKTKLVQVTDALNDMTTERDALIGLLEDAKRSINQLDNDNASAKKTIIDLTEQLNKSMSDRADIVRKTSGLLERMENERKPDDEEIVTDPAVNINNNQDTIEVEEDYEIDTGEEDDSENDDDDDYEA